jgi:SAM-dependent methyltransferase/uncharacterized OsmC-like protein
MRVTGIWKGGYQTLHEGAGGHVVNVDLPRDEGGHGIGPFALELNAMSPAGCITTIFALVAKKRRLSFERMEVDLDWKGPGGSPTISSVDGLLRVETSAPREEVETVLDITMRTCPVGVLYEKAHVPVRVRLEVATPMLHDADPPQQRGAGAEPGRPASVTHSHRGSGDRARRAWTREEGLEVLEAPDRRTTQDPEVLWSRVGVRSGEIVVDVGAGTGFFSVPAARRVGPNGRVYAVDLSEELVALLRTRRDQEAVPQLTPVLCTATSIPLDSAIADVVLLANVLHDIPPSTVSEAVRILKPGGRLVNVDWKKKATPGGPPAYLRLTPDEAAKLLEEHGLETVERWEFGPWHYGLVLQPSRTAAPSTA